MQSIGQMSTQASHSMHSDPVKTVWTSQLRQRSASASAVAARGLADALERRKLVQLNEWQRVAPRGTPDRIHRKRAALDCAPHLVVHDDEQHWQIMHGRGVVHGGGIAEHVCAVTEDGDDEAFRPRQLGAERGASAPAQTRRGTRSEIRVGQLEGAMLGE
jgi:hypothetical protein